MYVIYLDILFLINWIMDTLIFYCVSLVLNKRIKHRYTLVAGALAALIYCMLLVIPVLQQIPYIIYSLIIPMPSLLILYRPNRYKVFFKEYLLSVVIAAVFGGIIFNSWYLIYGAESRVSSISIILLIGIGISVSGCFYGGFYFIRRQLIFPTFEYQLTINYRGGDIQIQSLLDTGNLLYTPRKHEPVLVAEYEVVKPLLTKEEQQKYEQFRKSNEVQIEEGVISGFYGIEQLIPFNSVGCKNGFLWSVRVDSVEIKKYSRNIKIRPCIVGLYSGKLFSDSRFQALLHPEFILEEEMAS